MKLIEQSHEIISMDKDILINVEKVGRTCYKSKDKISSDTSIPFVKRLIKNNHHAILEFCDITVKFITNRGVTHELVRHRLCSFAQESTRYVKYNDVEFILPIWFYPIDCLSRTYFIWTESMKHAEKNYLRLITEGWIPQQAREVLPNSLKTEIVVKANLREWRHILELRCSKKAHPQMRALMLPLLSELKTKIPVIFEDIHHEL